ncbi:3-oxoadipate enol-lactone hydrolase [Lepidopterella palustris CBS 459.81]|uniref:3-oxoadipate enol-lactone hydrolase n=1 Tax=Lepidopterella palustris CBS 459.81 TaxID=1314670 RepID=A0A8E2JGP6_9PEZI|nr:3-oxoadipate enol-lactone hydrolase [Lepidopterella palustris CBS 459.81]
MPFLQLGYKKIHYTDSKPGDNVVRETFILTHGLGSSQDYYGAIVAGLITHHFRCISFDTTGAGRSPYTQVEQSIESLSNDIIGIMDALDVSKAIVVGHSMGGIVAANLAAERSDRVVAAVMIGPVYPSNSVADIFDKRIQVVEKEGMEPMANTISTASTGKKASPVARAFIRELLLAQDPAGYISNCRVIASAKPPNYAKIAVPVLILAGEEDKSAPLQGCEKMFEQMGTSEKKMEVLKGVGHWHCVEAFEEVGKQILTFYHDIQ